LFHKLEKNAALIVRRVEVPNTLLLTMQAEAFLMVIATGVIVILLSIILDAVWARVIPAVVYLNIIRAPGVIVHECSHMLGCLLTGAKIRKVVLFSRGGGSVTYFRPAIPYLGDIIINTAPLFCIPLLLAGLAWIFTQYLGCAFPALPSFIGSPEALLGLVTGIAGVFARNLVISFNPWFLLYLYLSLSLVLSMAPSTQDLKNAVPGLILLTLAGIIIIWSAVPWAVDILWEITRLVGMGFALGLAFELIVFVISVPLIIWYSHAQTG
jgi:hypothetical protein